LGYGNILRKGVLDAPRLGTFNLHPSALPEYRGLHPDLYAMMDGRNQIGITLHRMDSRIDTGPIVSQSLETLSPDDTIVTLSDRIYARGAVLIEGFFNQIMNDEQIPNTVQPSSVDPLDHQRIINWHDSGWRINNLVRALTYPWPMAKTYLAGKPLLVSKVRETEDGAIEPGLILEFLDDGIRVGTGGHSVDILELRNTDREIIRIDDLKSEFQVAPGSTRFEDSNR
jgi:methionyl-tRNA formyltransferase